MSFKTFIYTSFSLSSPPFSLPYNSLTMEYERIHKPQVSTLTSLFQLYFHFFFYLALLPCYYMPISRSLYLLYLFVHLFMSRFLCFCEMGLCWNYSKLCLTDWILIFMSFGGNLRVPIWILDDFINGFYFYFVMWLIVHMWQESLLFLVQIVGLFLTHGVYADWSDFSK